MEQTSKDLSALSAQMTVCAAPLRPAPRPDLSPAPFPASPTPFSSPRRPAPPRSLVWCLLAHALTRRRPHTPSVAALAAPQGLKEQTIAEVLESDPAMRAEIEEEMKNHQWGA